jgi:hypothetical protein
MVDGFSKVMCSVVLVSISIFVGCGRGYKVKDEVVVRHPLVDSNFVMPDYAAQVFRASGARKAWARTRRIHADCVSTFYKPDGSPHLTEYHIEICPWPSSIVVSASEPQGELKWSFSASNGKVLKGGEWPEAYSTAVCGRDFLEAVLDITTAPMRLLDYGTLFSRAYDPVRIEGIWYYPIERKGPDQTGPKRYWSRVIFYQNRDSSLVDTIWFAGADGEKSLMVRGYDYRQTEKGGVLIPTIIEVFRADARGFLKERLVKVDFYGLGKQSLD